MLRNLHARGPTLFFERKKWRLRNHWGNRCTLETGERINFFNWAHGITSTFQSRRAMTPVLEELSVKTQKGNFGSEIAEHARNQIADVFHVSPRTVFFTTSSSYCIPYYLRLIGLRHPSYTALLSNEELEATATFVKGENHQFEVLTWPNHNQQFAEDPITFNPPNRFHVVPLDAQALAEKACAIEGPLFILASHVGRITGTKLDLESLCALLSSRKDPTYIVIDGNMSFLIEPIDVKRFGLSGYICGTSKTVGAEPVVGFGYIREDLLDELNLSETEKIAYQFSCDTGLAKGLDAQHRISLAELFSFSSLFPSALDYFIQGKPALRKAYLQSKFPENPFWTNYFGDSNFFMFMVPRTHYEYPEQLIPFLAQYNILAAEMPRNYSFLKDHIPRMRISWNHINSEADYSTLINGLVSYREDLRETYCTCRSS